MKQFKVEWDLVDGVLTKQDVVNEDQFELDRFGGTTWQIKNSECPRLPLVPILMFALSDSGGKVGERFDMWDINWTITRLEDIPSQQGLLQ